MASTQAAPRLRNVLFNLAAVTCLVTAGGLGWYAATKVNESRELRAALDVVSRRAELAELDAARYRRAHEDARARASILAAPDLNPVTLDGQPGAQNASGRAFWSPTRGVVLAVSGIAPPPPGRVYQLWSVVRPNPVSAGVLRVDDAGRIFDTISLGTSETGLPIALAVTVEPESGVDEPTGDVLLLGRTGR